MQYKKWMENLTPEDMPNDDLRFVAETVGLKQALIFIFLLAGLSIYIPKFSFKRIKERYILNQYDGTRKTINRLALECDLSQRYIYKLINKKLKKKTSNLNPNPK